MDTTTDTGTTEAIVRNTWDHQDYDAAVSEIPALAEAVARLGRAHPTGADAMGDLWGAMFKAAPRRPERAAMKATHVVNHALAGVALESDQLQDLRRHTKGNAVSTAMGCVAYANAAAKIYEQLAPLQEEAEAAAAAEDALNEFLAANDGNDLDEGLEAELARLSEEAEAAAGELDALVDGASDQVGRAVRTGLATAVDQAEAGAEALAGMGLTAGDVARMDGPGQLRLATRLTTPRLREIAAMMGRVRNMARSARTARTNSVPEERHDVTLGRDLGRVLSSELVGLAVPALEFDFYDRFTRGRLLQHDVRGREDAGNGPIIYVGDFSDSMYQGKGEKAKFCKAMGGALFSVARDEGRAFWAIDFAGPGQVKVFAFPDPDNVDPNLLLDYFDHGFTNSGTCFETGLGAALEILQGEFAATGRTSADITFSTDGQAHVSPAWMDNFKAEQARMEFHVYGVAIACSVDAEPFRSICDGRAETLHDLVTGKNVDAMFRAIS